MRGDYRTLLEQSEPLTNETRCSYCRLPFGRSPLGRASFHVDHIVPISSAPQLANVFDNLAWACLRCNQTKGAHEKGYDGRLQRSERLFNPRKQEWTGHFRGTSDGKIYGATGVGRATSSRLRFNDEAVVVRHRSTGFTEGWWPGVS